MEQVKKFSPTAFVIIIFCFFLPFVNITCGGQKVMSLTGIKLITGAEYKPQSVLDEKDMPVEKSEEQKEKLLNKDEKIKPQPMALFALLMAIIGLVLSFIKKKATTLICMIVSILGAAFLLLLKTSLDSDIPSDAQMVVDVEYQFWYWLALIMFVVGAVLQWFNFKDSEAPITVSDFPSS